MSNTSVIDAGGNDGVRVDDTDRIFLHIERCKWCAELLAVAYSEQQN